MSTFIFWSQGSFSAVARFVEGVINIFSTRLRPITSRYQGPPISFARAIPHEPREVYQFEVVSQIKAETGITEVLLKYHGSIPFLVSTVYGQQEISPREKFYARDVPMCGSDLPQHFVLYWVDNKFSSEGCLPPV